MNQPLCDRQQAAPAALDAAPRGGGMSRRWWRLLALFAVAVFGLAACGSDGDTADAVDIPVTTVETGGESSSGDAAAELAEAATPGSWAVGQTTLEVIDDARDGRSFSVDVWYPVDAEASGDLTPADYLFIPGVGYTSEVSFADAPAADGPFPLVVYSHGSGGFRWVATFFTEFLASKGFVVAAPDHTGNTAIDTFAGSETSLEVTAVNRPGDVTVTIDTVLAASDDIDGLLGGRVDATNIAVTGHSFGGFTALAAASGFDGDEGSVPADSRVSAVVAMAPFSIPLSDDELSAIDVPVLVISATDDTRTPVATNTERVWDLVSGRPVVRIDLEAAVHNSFTDLCDLKVRVGAEGDVPDAIIAALDESAGNSCDPEVLAFGEVQRLTNAYSAAFLATELAGSSAFGEMLACDDPPAAVVCSVRD